MYKDDKSKPRKDDNPKQRASAKQRASGKRTSKARAKDAAESPRTPRIKAEPDPRQSRSLEYGVAILESFSSEQQTLGIADIAKLVGIGRSTTHRYAMTLVALGYLEQNSKRKYRLARRAADPGSAVIGTIRHEVAARTVLERLREESGHTVSMGALDGSRIIYLYRLFSHGVGQYTVDGDLGVGAHIPAHCTALGKVLLASLSDAERRELLAGIKLRRHGPNTIVKRAELVGELERISPREVVVSDEELLAGSRSIAVLVPRPPSERALAIDITVPSSAYTVDELLKRFGPRIKRAAKLISGQ